MKITENIMIFIACLSFGLFMVAQLGLGGEKIQAMQSWETLGVLLGIGVVAAVAVIGTGLAISGTEVSVIGTGGKIGNRVAEAAALGVWIVFYVALVGYASLMFWNLDYIGHMVGPFFGFMATLVFIIDVIARTMPGGK